MWTLVQTASILLRWTGQSHSTDILSSCTMDPMTPRSKAPAPTSTPLHGHPDRVQTLPQEQAFLYLHLTSLPCFPPSAACPADNALVS